MATMCRLYYPNTTTQEPISLS